MNKHAVPKLNPGPLRICDNSQVWPHMSNRASTLTLESTLCVCWIEIKFVEFYVEGLGRVGHITNDFLGVSQTTLVSHYHLLHAHFSSDNAWRK